MEQRSDETKEDYEEALLLVLGYKSSTDIEKTEFCESIVERYYISITASNIESAIAEFQYSLDISHRKEAAQALIAYFNWCWKSGKNTVSNGVPIDSFILQFSQIAFK